MQACSIHPSSSPPILKRNTEDGELHITLTKLESGEPWPAVIQGHEVDPVTQQQEQQRLMLERFQREVCSGGWQWAWRVLLVAAASVAPATLASQPDPRPPTLQHPGFDFSQATFNGEAPNPRTFLGGMGEATGS